MEAIELMPQERVVIFLEGKEFQKLKNGIDRRARFAETAIPQENLIFKHFTFVNKDSKKQ